VPSAGSRYSKATSSSPAHRRPVSEPVDEAGLAVRASCEIQPADDGEELERRIGRGRAIRRGAATRRYQLRDAGAILERKAVQEACRTLRKQLFARSRGRRSSTSGTRRPRWALEARASRGRSNRRSAALSNRRPRGHRPRSLPSLVGCGPLPLGGGWLHQALTLCGDPHAPRQPPPVHTLPPACRPRVLPQVRGGASEGRTERRRRAGSRAG